MFFTLICIALFCYGMFYTIVLYFLDCDVQLAFYEKFGKKISHLKGKVVFITGASSGIGKHTAIALARQGIKLVLAARRQNELEKVKVECIAASNNLLTPKDVLVLPLDMLDIKSHQRCFDTALQHFGQLDVLFNNAGRSQRATWEKIDMLVDKEMFELNVFSVVNLTRIAINYFNTKGRGHVAVTSSLAGLIGAPFSATYTGSKHAIHGYFDSLRIEKTDSDLKLTVSIICPGPTFSNFLQESFTHEPGEKYGISVTNTDRRMTGERCGELCAITMANEIEESWLAVFPLMTFTYIMVYCPIIRNILMKVVGTQKLFKLRDSKEILLTEVKTGEIL